MDAVHAHLQGPVTITRDTILLGKWQSAQPSLIRFLGAQPSNKKAHGDAVQTEQCMDEQGYVYSTSHLCSVRYPKVGAECYSTTWRAKPVTVERPRFSRRRMPSLPTMP